MPNTPLTRRQGSGIIQMLLIGFAVQLGILGYVFYQSYVGREDVVKSQRKGCERGKLDREANAEGWRAAERVRLATFANQEHLVVEEAQVWLDEPSRPDDPPDLIAARRYNRIATGLEVRSKIDCAKAYPKAGIFP